MKQRSLRKLVPGLIGLLALMVYVLACVSFSPDDTKVLYPAFDPPSGAVGLALYDRETHRSEMLFLPVTHPSGTNSPGVNVLRGQWLVDGHRILLAWATNQGEEDNALNVALLPWGGGRTSQRLFRLPGIKDAAVLLQMPLCVANDCVFFMGDKAALRLDLKTGAVVEHEFADAKQDVILLPAPDEHRVFYLENNGSFGRLDPETFQRTVLMTITNDFIDGTFIAYDWSGQTVAGIESHGGTNRVVVVREGKTVFSRPLDLGWKEATFGNALFSRKGDRLWASYQKPLDTNSVAYGLVEIPLSEAPLREIPLIAAAPKSKDSMAGLFQFGLSHDGKTAAAVSTYLAVGEDAVKPGDYALFFVDLSKPQHAVTKIPLPRPQKR